MRRRVARLTVAIAVLALLGAATGTTLSSPADERPALRAGHVERPAAGPTVIGVQGFHVDGRGSYKKPARLVSVAPEGTPRWTVSSDRGSFQWFYDVDPLPNGNLLVTSTRPNVTVVYELDPATRDRVWTERLPIEDTHDVDKLPDGTLVVANMRNYDAERGVSNDRVFVYDRRTDTVVWEWTVRNHFPPDADGGMSADWSHVNDVDAVDGGFLISLRNFDQVVRVDRETREIVWRLGRETTTTRSSSSTTPTTSGGRTGRRPSWSRTRRTTGSSSTPAGTGSGSGSGPSRGTSRGPATPTTSRTATRSSRTRSTTGSWR